MVIGKLSVDSNLFLSPLAGYTNLPMRMTLRELGGLGWATTDLVNARSLIERNPTALKLVESCEGDRPLSVQLFGSVAGRDAGRRGHVRGHGRPGGRHQHGLPGAKGDEDRRRLRHDDRAREDLRARPPDDRRGRDPGDGEDAPRLGLGEHHRAGPRPRPRGRGRRRGLHPRPHARPGILRHREPGRHRRGRRRRPLDPGHRKRGHHDPGVGEAHARGDGMRRRKHRPRRVLRPMDLPQDGALPEDGRAPARARLRRAHARDAASISSGTASSTARSAGRGSSARWRPGTRRGSGRRSRSSSGSSPSSPGPTSRRRSPSTVAWRAPFCDPSGELLPKYQPAPMSPSFIDADEASVFSRGEIPVPRGPVETW